MGIGERFLWVVRDTHRPRASVPPRVLHASVHAVSGDASMLARVVCAGDRRNSVEGTRRNSVCGTLTALQTQAVAHLHFGCGVSGCAAST